MTVQGGHAKLHLSSFEGQARNLGASPGELASSAALPPVDPVMEVEF